MIEPHEYPNSRVTAEFLNHSVDMVVLTQVDETANAVHHITLTADDALSIALRLLDRRKPSGVLPPPLPGFDAGKDGCQG